MKILKTGLSLALLGTGLVSVTGLQSTAQATAPAPTSDKSLVKQIRDNADGTVKVTKDTGTGKVSFLRASGAKADLLPSVDGSSRAKAIAKADKYLDSYSAAFGARADELVQSDVRESPYGVTVSYTQEYKGVPVFGSTLRANFDKQGDLTSVNGFAAPDLKLGTDARLSAAEAGSKAVALVKSDPPKSEQGNAVAVDGLEAVHPTLTVYREGAIRGATGADRLAYIVEVTNNASVRDVVFVDADSGKLINRWSTIHTALERELHEESLANDPVWSEGDPFPGDLNQDQSNMVQSAGESYWFYKNAWGRDSYDGEGAKMITVNNDPRISCPNANWNGVTTNYCDGVSSDDVVSHEWGHAYTEYTSGLIYQWQSGALNESYSDVWGETVDLINGREDEGEGDLDVKREVGSCDPTAPAALQVAITAPEAQAGPCTPAIPAAFGPDFGTEEMTADVVVGMDEANDAGPATTDGCTAFTNAGDFTGKWVYIDRGGCSFQIKIDNVATTDAKGIVFGNNVNGIPVSVSGTNDDLYGLMVTKDDGQRFKDAETATITVKAEDTSERTPTNRWLVGEKSTAFGGAIRDMWNPNCYQDPAKVSDVEYNCDFAMTDSGGVHSNSGVPNHAYALVVDGGTYNNVTVKGIGLDKAAAVWFRAQDNYLTPTSDFTDAADALETSCSNLVGQQINKLTTEAKATPQKIAGPSADDCVQVGNAMKAVEMRTDPVQCAFEPMFEKGKPELCGGNTKTKKVFADDFENGIGKWSKDFELAFEGGVNKPWEASDEAPVGHTGGTAYGPAPDFGQCTNGSSPGDFSSVDYLISPTITMPSGTLTSPSLTWDHTVITENGYDGGTVKYSVDGGKTWEIVPADAYTFNGPRVLAAAPTNTNPLAGKPGFTGTDGGTLETQWGTSSIDLAKLGIKSGTKFQFSFGVGRDGCGGVDGWYIDNVKVTVCEEKAAPLKTTTNAKVTKKTITKKGKTVVVTKVKAGKVKVNAGKVEIRRAGKVIAKGSLFGKNGTLRLTVKGKSLKIGNNKLVVKYLGTNKFKPSKDNVWVKVKRR